MIKDWETLGVGFASSFLGAIVKIAGLKMNEKGDIVTESGSVLTMKYILKKSIFGVCCGVIFTGFISDIIAKDGFNWLMVIGFLIGYGGEHFLPIVLVGVGKYVKGWLAIKGETVIKEEDENSSKN